MYICATHENKVLPSNLPTSSCVCPAPKPAWVAMHFSLE